MVDKIGNVYLTKGHSKKLFYPCLSAHMDTVQELQTNWIAENLQRR